MDSTQIIEYNGKSYRAFPPWIADIIEAQVKGPPLHPADSQNCGLTEEKIGAYSFLISPKFAVKLKGE